MEHLFWLRTGQLAGRTGPNRDPWAPLQLASAGIGAVLSVNFGEMVREEELAAAGIQYARVSLSDNAPPLPGDMEHCLRALPQAMEFVIDAQRSGSGVLVHCNSGKDRTGLFMCYYLCRTEELSPQAAMREVRRVRPIAFSAEGWESFTREVLEQANDRSG